MTPGRLNLTLQFGAAFSRKLVWKDQVGRLINLTGCSAAMQIRESAESSVVLMEASTGNGRIALGGAAGTINIAVPAAITKDLTFKVAVYDLLVTMSDGEPVRLLEGKVIGSPGVTRL